MSPLHCVTERLGSQILDPTTSTRKSVRVPIYFLWSRHGQAVQFTHTLPYRRLLKKQGQEVIHDPLLNLHPVFPAVQCRYGNPKFFRELLLS